MTTKAERDAALHKAYIARAERDTDWLIGALRDPEVRRTAARFLGELGERAAVEPLIPLLQASDPHSRAAAAIALGRIGSRDAIRPLVALAEQDRIGWVRAWGVAALADLDAREVAPRIADLLEDRDWMVRRAALSALARFADSRTLEKIRLASARELWRRRRHYRKAIKAIER